MLTEALTFFTITATLFGGGLLMGTGKSGQEGVGQEGGSCQVRGLVY
jgi:hypothetical protein